jgi:hypothetical protein
MIFKRTPIDLRLRGAIPKEEAELLAAFEYATGRDCACFDYQRASMLHALACRDVTPDDIVTVVRYVRRLMRTGENKRKVGTFTPASLEFVNLLGDCARFMDRLQTAREDLVRRAHRGKGMGSVTLKLSESDSITRLVPVERAAVPIREAIVGSLLALVKDLQK